MTFWDSVMKEIFPWIFAAALLLAGSAFLYAGVKLTSTAWTLKTFTRVFALRTILRFDIVHFNETRFHCKTA